MFHIVIHPQSYLTVRGFVDYLIRVLSAFQALGPKLHKVSDFSEASIPSNSICFVIGFRIAGVRARRDILVVYLNFSVLYPIKGFLPKSFGGAKLMRRKRRQFRNLYREIDQILDFFPLHTAVLKKRFPSLEVQSFPIDVNVPEPVSPIESALYDVCIVGNPTPRRLRLHQNLLKAGLTLSPVFTDNFSQTVQQSRLVLNAHTHKYDNCEGPRIVTSMACGRTVATESTIGLDDLAPDFCFYKGSYRELVRVIEGALSNEAQLKQNSMETKKFYEEVYRDKCLTIWTGLLDLLVAGLNRKLGYE